MQEVSYETVKNLILSYYDSKEYYEEEIVLEKEKEDILFSILKSEYPLKDKIKNFKIISTDKFSTIFYDTINQNTNKSESHILIYNEIDRKKFPLFKVDYYKSNSKTLNYHESTYIIYQEKSHRIDSKMKFATLNNGEFEDTTVIVLNNTTENDYNLKKYHLCLKEEKPLSIKIANRMYVDGEEGFDNRLKPMIRNVYQISSKIGNKLKIILEEDAKVYEIKRK